MNDLVARTFASTEVPIVELSGCQMGNDQMVSHSSHDRAARLCQNVTVICSLAESYIHVNGVIRVRFVKQYGGWQRLPFVARR